MSAKNHSSDVRLSDVIRVRRRYSRSINLERDLDIVDSLEGYLVSPLAREACKRVFDAVLSSGAPRAWTVTGVYGTGKSAFMHFLLSLAGPGNSQSRRDALRLLQDSDDDQPFGRRLRQR
ncbi:MAG: hypothetical protein ACK5HM_14960, partial [Gemmatimonas sp.]|uniref:hypothetical protein n=1 Tax=Gemmatimonas sp. TaxID=1962908 RepID=UPI003918E4FD